MKALITSVGTFGPFDNITTLVDRYQCDDSQMQFSVVGIGQIVDASTIDWPAPVALAVIVPHVVTMRQARLSLLSTGLLSNVASAINALPSPQKEAASIEWEYSQTVERNRGFVVLLGKALGLTETQLDDLFILANTL